MTNEHKFLSVLTRTHQRPKFLRRCLDSLKKQTKRNFVIVLISDCKEDKVDSLVSEYSDLSIVVKHIDNPVIWPSCNIYFNMVKDIIDSDYIVFVDDDDVVIDDSYFETLEDIVVKNTVLRYPVIMSRSMYCPNASTRIPFPEEMYWNKFPIYSHVSTLNFCVRSDLYKKFEWPNVRGGDFYFINTVFKNIDWKKDVYWYDKLTTKIDHSGLGLADDNVCK